MAIVKKLVLNQIKKNTLYYYLNKFIYSLERSTKESLLLVTLALLSALFKNLLLNHFPFSELFFLVLKKVIIEFLTFRRTALVHVSAQASTLD